MFYVSLMKIGFLVAVVPLWFIKRNRLDEAQAGWRARDLDEMEKIAQSSSIGPDIFPVIETSKIRAPPRDTLDS